MLPRLILFACLFFVQTEITPNTPLDLAEEAIDTLLNDKMENMEQKNYFLKVALPKFIKSLLQRREVKSPTRLRMNNFLILVLDLIVEYIPQG